MAVNNNLLVWSKDLSKGFNLYIGPSTINFPTDGTVGGDMVAYAENSNTDGVVGIGDRPQLIAVKPGETYTASADFKTNHTGEIYFVVKLLDANKNEIISVGENGKRAVTWDTWYRISSTVTIPDGVSYMFTTYRFRNTTGVFPSGLSIYHPKLEVGSISTDYRPAGIESPNLIRNGHFYKGKDYWNVTDVVKFPLSIDEDGSLRMVEAVDSTALHNSTYTTQPLALNKTYMLTMEAKTNMTFTAPPFFPSNETAGLASTSTNIQGGATMLPSDTYNTYIWKIVMPATGSTANRISFSATTFAFGQSLNIKSIKLEEGIYATEWTAAPEDIAVGIDRAVIARAEKTIVDFNDTVNLVAKITPNLSNTQQYKPETGVFTPSWASTNLILTASLFKSDSTNDIIGGSNIQSIKWYRVSAQDGVNPVLIAADSTYVIGANTLTIKQNVLSDRPSVNFICEIIYRDTTTSKDLIVKKDIAFNRVNDGAALIKAKVYLPDGSNLTNGAAEGYDANTSDYGRNILRNTEDFSGWVNNDISKVAIAGTYLGATYYTAKDTWKYYYLDPSKFEALKAGETYTVSVWLKADIAAQLNPVFTCGQTNTNGTIDNVLRALRSTSGDTKVTTDWRRWTTTFTFSPTGAEYQVVTRVEANGFPTDGSNTMYVSALKLEKGNTATRWSQAPEDYPAIIQEATPKKWIWEMYDQPTYTASIDYASIKGKRQLMKKLIADGTDLNPNIADSYMGRIRTAIYSERIQSAPIVFTGDNASRVYVNGDSIKYTDANVSNIPATLSLKEGWNTLDFMFSEAGGGDGIWGIKVGNTNLQTRSGRFTNDVGLWSPNGSGATISSLTLDKTVTYNGYNTIKVTGSNDGMVINNSSGWITLKPDTLYTYSVMAKSNMAITGTNSTPLHMWVSDVAGGGANIHQELIQSNNSSLPANEWKLAHVVFKTPNVASTYYMRPFVYGIGSATINVAYSKVEEGTTPTPWSAAPADNTNVNPNIFGEVFKVDAYYATDYANRITSITAKAELTRASVIDTTNVSYQWYKKDSTILTDQGGGVGWLKLISTSPETGYNTDTLVIPSTAINIFEVYKCAIKDTQTDSITYNTSFEGLVSVTNSTLPIEVRVDTDGTVLLNGVGQKTVKARLFQGGKEIDTEGTMYTYQWYRWLSNGTKDTTWNSTGFKTGKTLTITASDVDEKATFSIEVS